MIVYVAILHCVALLFFTHEGLAMLHMTRIFGGAANSEVALKWYSNVGLYKKANKMLREIRRRK